MTVSEVYESSFLPEDASSTYREEDGLWHTKARAAQVPGFSVEGLTV